MNPSFARFPHGPAMFAGSSGLEIVVLTVSATTVLVYGLALLVRITRDGEMGRIFARAEVDPRTRATILWGVGIISTMFATLVVLAVVEEFGLLSADLQNFLSSAVLLIAAATLLYLTRTGMTLASLSLTNELDLRDSSPEVFETLSGPRRAPFSRPSPLYEAFALEEARRRDLQRFAGRRVVADPDGSPTPEVPAPSPEAYANHRRLRPLPGLIV